MWKKNIMSYEVLLGKDLDENTWEIVGYTDAGAMAIPGEEDLQVLYASKIAIERAKILLDFGRKVYVSKSHEFEEIIPDDLIESEENDLETQKNIALHEIRSRMHQCILGVSIFNIIDYVTESMRLMSNGIFITNENREEKYLKIIEKSMEVKNPEPISEDASCEEEQKYLEEKDKYDEAQNVLKSLENYLSAYDRISQLKFIYDTLNTAKNDITKAISKEEIQKAVDHYKETIEIFKGRSPEEEEELEKETGVVTENIL